MKSEIYKCSVDGCDYTTESSRGLSTPVEEYIMTTLETNIMEVA